MKLPYVEGNLYLEKATKVFWEFIGINKGQYGFVPPDKSGCVWCHTPEKEFFLTVELLVTENRTTNVNRFSSNMVRIFVDRNYDYGYWINEAIVYNAFSPEQQKQYLETDIYHFDIDIETAQKLIDLGMTPYNKQILLRIDT